MFDHTSASLGLAVLVAAMSAGCDAARPPAAPTPKNAATEFVALSKADVPATGVFAVPIEKGTLEISGWYSAVLDVESKTPARFSWKGNVYDGGSPYGIYGAPGETVSIVSAWVGSSLTGTTMTWGQTVFTDIGSQNGDTGGRFQVNGTITLPPHTGQRTDKVRGTFTLDADSMFSGAGLRLNLSGSGRTAVTVEWDTDCCWRITHVTYRFN